MVLPRAYLLHGNFNRTFLITSIFESNPAFMELHVAPADIYQDTYACQYALNEILEKVEEAWEVYDAMVEYRKLWKKWSKKLQACTPSELAVLEAIAYQEPIQVPFPSPLLVIDDMSHFLGA